MIVKYVILRDVISFVTLVFISVSLDNNIFAPAIGRFARSYPNAFIPALQPKLRHASRTTPFSIHLTNELGESRPEKRIEDTTHKAAGALNPK